MERWNFTDLPLPEDWSECRDMGTPVFVPHRLLREAQKVLGSDAETVTVCLSLWEVIRRSRLGELAGLYGKVTLEEDIGENVPLWRRAL